MADRREPLGVAPATIEGRALARKVLETEAAAILALVDRLDERFDQAVQLLLECKGRVILTGMGKSGIICQKIAATLSSTGTASFFMHPAEAMHGDLGVIRGDDVVVALSYSGETDETAATARTDSASRREADCHHRQRGIDTGAVGRRRAGLQRHEEACPMNLVPTASTTAALAIGDALAMTLLVEKGFRQEDFASLHPGGKLGKRLMRVEALMHSGNHCPIVRTDTRMRDVIYEMSSKGLGMTCVVDGDDALLGHHHGRRSAAAHGARHRDSRSDRRRRDDAAPDHGRARHARGRGAQYHGAAEDHRDRGRGRPQPGMSPASCTSTTCGGSRCSEAWVRGSTTGSATSVSARAAADPPAPLRRRRRADRRQDPPQRRRHGEQAVRHQGRHRDRLGAAGRADRGVPVGADLRGDWTARRPARHHARTSGRASKLESVRTDRRLTADGRRAGGVHGRRRARPAGARHVSASRRRRPMRSKTCAPASIGSARREAATAPRAIWWSWCSARRTAGTPCSPSTWSSRHERLWSAARGAHRRCWSA